METDESLTGTQGELPVDESAIIISDITAETNSESASSVFVVLRMVLVLALAALAIYGVVFFIKRMARPREINDPNLKVLARVPLAGDSFAAVLSLGTKAWLVAGGSGGVNLISEINDQESLETLLIEDAKRNAGTGPFLDFRSLLKRLGGIPREAENSDPLGKHAENLRKQRERLKGL